MSFVYTIGVPNPPSNPSADVFNMQTNTNSLGSILNVDLIGFGSPGIGQAVDGRHRQVSLFNETNPAVPFTTNTGGVLFAGLQGAQSWPFWQNAATFLASTPIQLIAGIPTSATIGFTYLPGNILMQWGTTLAAASGVAILFPKLYSGVPYSVQVTVTNNSTNHRTYTSTNGVGASGFEPILLSTNGNAETDDIMWIAIGPV